jgi:hypothetical protein
MSQVEPEEIVSEELVPIVNSPEYLGTEVKQTGRPFKPKTADQELARQLRLQKVSIERVVKTFVDAINATKVITSHTEPDYEVPDHPTRLRAATLLIDLMGLKKVVSTKLVVKKKLISNDDQTVKDISKALKSGDTVELSKTVFNKYGNRE